MTNSEVKFGDILAQKELDTNPQRWLSVIEKQTQVDVERALKTEAGKYTFEKLLALISPVAENYLEQMAQAANLLTVKRFGRTIRLYAPLYLSNFCINSCKYCGFNVTTNFKRTRLTIDQALADADVIAAEGFRDILLVSSEDPKFINVDYLCELARHLREKFSSISIEIYQLEQSDYKHLLDAGIEGVTLYQETYDKNAYAQYHPAGKKRDYARRLRAADDMCTAGMREIGLGSLLGLTDWRTETLSLAEHAEYLMKRYWQSRVSFSFPRLRPACSVDRDKFPHLLSDKQLVQMILALRLCFADAGMNISTRESAELRDRLNYLGVTRMSAGSRTNPGGYSGHDKNTKQFEIADTRTPKQVAEMIKQKGFEPVWKDWDKSFVK